MPPFRRNLALGMVKEALNSARFWRSHATVTEVTTKNAHAANATQGSSSCTWWRRACADLRWILSFIRLVSDQDGMLRETPVARRVVACIMALVPELFQTFPDLNLELENGE